MTNSFSLESFGTVEAICRVTRVVFTGTTSPSGYAGSDPARFRRGNGSGVGEEEPFSGCELREVDGAMIGGSRAFRELSNS